MHTLSSKPASPELEVKCLRAALDDALGSAHLGRVDRTVQITESSIHVSTQVTQHPEGSDRAKALADALRPGLDSIHTVVTDFLSKRAEAEAEYRRGYVVALNAIETMLREVAKSQDWVAVHRVLDTIDSLRRP